MEVRPLFNYLLIVIFNMKIKLLFYLRKSSNSYCSQSQFIILDIDELRVRLSITSIFSQPLLKA